MSTDRKYFTVECTKCNVTESHSVSESFGLRSSWDSAPEFEKFEAKWGKVQPKHEPELKAATCKGCGAVAKITTTY